MHRVEGTLISGTYIPICNSNSDNHVAKVGVKGNGYELLGTKDRNDENAMPRLQLTAS